MDDTPPTSAFRADPDQLALLAKLTVRIASGIVLLNGEVPSEALRRRIEQQILALPDVRDVHNYLKVVPPCDGLEAQLLATLCSLGVAVENLTVTIHKGVVTLSGCADSSSDRDAMARAAWTLEGVCEVDNRVGLRHDAPEPGGDGASASLS